MDRVKLIYLEDHNKLFPFHMTCVKIPYRSQSCVGILLREDKIQSWDKARGLVVQSWQEQ